MHVPRKANDDDCRFRIICTTRNPRIPCNYPLFRIFLSLLSTRPTSFLLRKLFILFGKYISYYFHFSHWLTEKNVVKLLFLFLMSFFLPSLFLFLFLFIFFFLPWFFPLFSHCLSFLLLLFICLFLLLFILLFLILLFFLFFHCSLFSNTDAL